jgi:hypothetical protein
MWCRSTVRGSSRCSPKPWDRARSRRATAATGQPEHYDPPLAQHRLLPAGDRPRGECPVRELVRGSEAAVLVHEAHGRSVRPGRTDDEHPASSPPRARPRRAPSAAGTPYPTLQRRPWAAEVDGPDDADPKFRRPHSKWMNGGDRHGPLPPRGGRCPVQHRRGWPPGGSSYRACYRRSPGSPVVGDAGPGDAPHDQRRQLLFVGGGWAWGR